MQKSIKLIVITLTILILSNFQSRAFGQVVVRVKPAPKKVVVVKPVRKRKNHIWVNGHWKWHRRSNTYVWVEGHWLKKTRGYAYVPGRWEQVRGGYKWIPGHWAAV